MDSHYPVYALSIPEVYNTWTWSEKYPGVDELNRYFQHVDDCVNISKDTLYHTRVTKAVWNDMDNKWHIECENGTCITTRFMNCCLGFAAKRYFPDWPGLEDYQGYICHSSFWPAEGVNMRGKRVAVVGSGATGVQIAQSSAREASELTVFIRTPNTCIPMKQSVMYPDNVEIDRTKLAYQLEKQRFGTEAGFLYVGQQKSLFEDTPKERDRVLQEAYDAGGFEILFTYNDLLTSEEANRYVYDFWAKRTRARLSNPAKRDILVPLEPLHPFGGKRPSLEQDFYEQMDKDHVKLIDLKQTKVSRVVPNGIITSDGVTNEFDIIAIATGFDSVTGSFTEIDIRGVNNESLREKWNGERGALSYLGMTVANFPNMFYTYGPHSPTAYANGPSIVEPQGEWIVDVMEKMRDTGKSKIHAQVRAEEEWKDTVNRLHVMTLRDKVDSWYMGTCELKEYPFLR